MPRSVSQSERVEPRLTSATRTTSERQSSSASNLQMGLESEPSICPATFFNSSDTFCDGFESGFVECRIPTGKGDQNSSCKDRFLTSDRGNKALSNTPLWRLLNIQPNFAQVSEIGSTFDHENTVIFFSSETRGIHIVAVPGTGSRTNLRDVIEMIMSAEYYITTFVGCTVSTGSRVNCSCQAYILPISYKLCPFQGIQRTFGRLRCI